MKFAPDGSLSVNLSNQGVNLNLTRHARRLYVGCIPPNATEQEISNLFRTIITSSLSLRENPVISVFINQEKSFAFVELISIELTTACCQLDGMSYRGNTIRIRRPNDYASENLPSDLGPIPTLSLASLGVVSSTVPDGPNKIFIGGLPHDLGDEDVKELLNAFGPLRSFHLVKDTPASISSPIYSKGYAFCEYMDPRNTHIAIEGLNNLPIRDKTLTVRLASQNASMSASSPPTSIPSSIYGPSGGMQNGYSGMKAGAGLVSGETPTRVLLLKNIVNRSEIQNDDEYQDILDDVREECSQHGPVLKVQIPRVKDGYPSAAEGTVFVEFADVESAKRSANSLKGRKFADQIVIVNYYDEIHFSDGKLV